MQTSVEALYLDSSALVKLVVAERESGHLVRLLASEARQTSCVLARVEVMRAARLHGGGAIERARQALADVHLIRLSNAVLDLAAEIGPTALRSLDAIHLAAAWRLRPNVQVITYDHRLGDAALALGLPVVSPGA